MRHLKYIFIFFGLITNFSTVLYAQCSVSIQPSINTIYCAGDNVELIATGIGTSNTVFLDDFNTQSTNPNWVTTPNGIYNTTCVSAVDGTPFFWIANSVSPREFLTPPLNLTWGGTLSVDIRLTELSEETGSGCNSPSENVFIQYNDASNNWYNLTSSFSPDPSLPPQWRSASVSIPPAAQWNGVQFRVIQTIPGFASNPPNIISFLQQRDNWGIDNFEIQANDPFYYDWSHISSTLPPGDNDTISVIPTATTTYQVSYTNNAGITCQDNVTINYDVLEILNVSTTIENCAGDNDGVIDVSIDGGSADYTYDLTGPSSMSVTSSSLNHSFSPLQPGTYDLTITDQNGCIVTQTGVVLNAGPVCCSITATDIIDNVTCFGFSDGQATVNPSNGTNPYTYLWNDPNAQTTPTATGLAAGTYACTITDQLCSINHQVTITEPSQLNFTYQKVDDTCSNNNGEIVISASGGTTPYEFSIDNGVNWQNSNQFLNLSFLSSPFSVILRDAELCSTAVQSVDIFDAPDPQVTNVNNYGPACYNGFTGFIEITASSLSNPLSYSIDGGATFQNTNTFSSLSSGSYSVLVEDVNGCQTSWGNVLFTNPPELIISAVNMVTPLCYDSCNGQIDIVANGGSGNLSYSIDGGTTFVGNNSFTNQCPGLFNIAVQDDSSCITSSNNQLLEPTDIQTTLTVTHPQCIGSSNGQVDFQVSGGTAPYTVSWSGPQLPTSPITGLTDGTYFLVVTDANGCLDSNEIIIATISSFPAPIIDSIIIDTPLCFQQSNGEISIYASGVGTPFSYDIGNSINTQNNHVFSNLSAGSYNVVVTDVNQCSSTSTPIQLQNPAQLVLVPQINNATCSYTNDGNIDLTASYGGTGNLEFSIDGVSYQSSGLFQNILPGNYDLYVRDANGCIENSMGTYLPPYPIDIQATVTNPTCYGFNDGQIIFTITGGTNPDTVTWSGRPNAGYGTNPTLGSIPWGINNNFITNNTISNLSSINDTIWVIDSNGCRDSLEVTVLDPNTAQIDTLLINDVLCHNDSTGSLHVLLQNSNSFIIDLDTFHIIQSDTMFINLPSDTGWVISFDSLGCRDSLQFLIHNPPPLNIIPFNDTVICIGSVLTYNMNITGGTPNSNPPPYYYYWDNTLQTNPFQLTPSTSSNYNYYALDRNGCSTDTLLLDVQLYPELSLSLSTYLDSICLGDSIEIEAFATGGSGTGYSYNWTNGLSNDSIHSLTPSQTTTYNLTLNDDCSTPTVSSSVTIEVVPLPLVDFTLDTTVGCFPHEVFLTQMNTDTSLTALWIFGDGGSSTNFDTVSHVFNSVGTYNVSLTLTGDLGCSDVHNDVVQVFDYPTADFIYNPITPTKVNNAVTFQNTSSNDVTNFYWLIENGSGTFEERFEESFNPILFNITQNDTLQTCLFVSTDIEGCVDTACYDIAVRDKFYIYTPNAFTPNNDGVNDVFLPVINGFDPEKFSMFIFDRWGNLVFESLNLNVGWNGLSSKNEECQSGVYVYKIVLEEKIDESNRAYIGNITLVR